MLNLTDGFVAETTSRSWFSQKAFVFSLREERIIREYENRTDNAISQRKACMIYELDVLLSRSQREQQVAWN
jgi:hypothetical protein